MSREYKFAVPAAATGITQLSPESIRLDFDLRLGRDSGRDSGQLLTRPIAPARHQLTQLACRIYDARRMRERMLGKKMFGEPSWDILLACYCLPTRGEMLSVTALAYAANVPPSTGHRWLRILMGKGLVENGPKCADGRRQLVRLTQSGRDSLEEYLTKLFYCETPIPPYPQKAGGE